MSVCRYFIKRVVTWLLGFPRTVYVRYLKQIKIQYRSEKCQIQNHTPERSNLEEILEFLLRQEKAETLVTSSRKYINNTKLLKNKSVAYSSQESHTGQLDILLLLLLLLLLLFTDEQVLIDNKFRKKIIYG